MHIRHGLFVKKKALSKLHMDRSETAFLIPSPLLN